MSTRFARFAPLGAIAAVALTLAPGAASALNLTYQSASALAFVKVNTSEKDNSGSLNTNAVPFPMKGDASPFLDEFIAWCFEIGPSLNTSNSGTEYTVENFLSPDALGRVQRVFDANYDDDTIQTSQPKGAAFQLAVWEAIYETTDATLSLSSGQFTSALPTTSLNNVRALADGYISAANAYDYTIDKREWVITQLKSDGHQNLGTATAIPLPAAAWLLLGVSGALIAAKRRSAHKEA